MRRAALVGLTVVWAVALVGCSGGEKAPVIESLTVDQAKAQTQAVEDQIVALIPEDAAGVVDQQAEGVLMSCSTEDTVRWAGGSTVTFTETPDWDALFARIEQGLAAETDGYTVTLTSTTDGIQTLDIEDADEGTWLISPWQGGLILHISSWSPCFPLPDGMRISDTY